MIVIKDRFWGLRVVRIWFEEANIQDADILRYVRLDVIPSSVRGSLYVDHEYTLISDLTLSEDEILLKMRKKVRYEVHRAEREDFDYCTFDADALSRNPSILREF